MTKNTKYTT